MNEAEQINIAQANRWLGRMRKRDILDDGFLRELHKRMFGDVWKWAGQYRLTPRNIGIDAYRIPMEVRQLVDDVRFWIQNETSAPDEIAVRFSHRLVSIHPFPNGNGRHSRMAGDLLAMQLGQPRFTWGRISLVSAGQTRKAYVAALQIADSGKITALLEFARD
jgi:Fic-DOC domain mobile mystery protein B